MGWLRHVPLLLFCSVLVRADHDPQPYNPNITNSFNITIDPHHLDLHWQESLELTVNISCQDAPPGLYHLTIVPLDPRVASIKHLTAVHALTCSSDDFEDASYTAALYGEFLGRTTLRIAVELVGFADDGTDESLQAEQNYPVVVMNEENALSRIFIIVVALFVIVINFGFGCKIDTKVVLEIIKRPIPPAIGMGCQFILMPLLGFGMSHLLHMDKVLGFGLLVTASAPGGGGSNIWTYLLGGDLNLSITMTLFSKTLALAMMPFWMFVFGRFYQPGTAIKIPYLNIVAGLLSIIFPCFLGILLASKRPEWAKKVVAAVRPLSIIFIFWVIIVGSITNMHVYPLMASQWYVIPAGTLLPYVGMLLGYVLSRVLQQGNRRSVTIAIETGIQDTGIAIILLLSSFPKPDGDIAATMPITAAIFTPMPLWIALLVITLYTRCWLGGRCKCCGGPDAEILHDIDDEEDQDEVLSTTNTKNSELTPGDERENHLEGLKTNEMGQGDRLLANHELRPTSNGHVV